MSPQKTFHKCLALRLQQCLKNALFHLQNLTVEIQVHEPIFRKRKQNLHNILLKYKRIVVQKQTHTTQLYPTGVTRLKNLPTKDSRPLKLQK